jgi:MOSC domain-containing protein YiiM
MVPSGIVKRPVEGPVLVRALGLEGDGQADPSVHGGERKAVYCYPSEHFAAWNAEFAGLGAGPGRMGENLTLAGFLEDDVRQGDVFRAGRALLEATSPRMPCYKLLTHLGSSILGKRMVETARTGWYCRVLEEGPVAAGDTAVRERHGAGPTVRAMVEAKGR